MFAKCLPKENLGKSHYEEHSMEVYSYWSFLRSPTRSSLELLSLLPSLVILANRDRTLLLVKQAIGSIGMVAVNDLSVRTSLFHWII